MKDISIKNTRNNKKPIPKFKSYEEEAQFWDTHDTTEFDFKPVKLKVAKNLEHILGIRLDAQTIDELDQKGREIGVGASTLARMWILEKLKSLSLPKRESQASKNLRPHVTLHEIKITK